LSGRRPTLRRGAHLTSRYLHAGGLLAQCYCHAQLPTARYAARWLDLYGEQNGFQRDTDLPNYDPRTDLTKFVFQKTGEFEAAVITHLKTNTAATTIATNPGDARDCGPISISNCFPVAKCNYGKVFLFSGLEFFIANCKHLPFSRPGAMPAGLAKSNAKLNTYAATPRRSPWHQSCATWCMCSLRSININFGQWPQDRQA